MSLGRLPQRGLASSISWLQEGWQLYQQPPIRIMLLLGFSAGLPLLMVLGTLSAWLHDAAIERTTIGFLSWIGLAYAIKVLWAPFIDHLPLPFLSRRYGRRRAWMLLAQLGILGGLVGMSVSNPSPHNLWLLGLFALCTAFCSATQDIVIDAYRIESASDKLQGGMVAAYVTGYRIGMISAGAGSLSIAGYYSWPLSYLAIAALMLIGITTTLSITEPLSNAVPPLAKRTRTLLAWGQEALIRPFSDFFFRARWLALVILAMAACYRISDITLGVMAIPFYLDLGFSKQEIAAISKLYGVLVTIIGIAFGSLLIHRYGLLRTLLFGGILAAGSNLLFSAMVLLDEPTTRHLMAIIIADNISGGIATAALIAYLSSLTNTLYTATQYALFSSLMSLPGKFIGGFSGLMVDQLGYASFFVSTAAMGLPAIFLILYLMRHPRQTLHRPAPTTQSKKLAQ